MARRRSTIEVVTCDRCGVSEVAEPSEGEDQEICGPWFALVLSLSYGTISRYAEQRARSLDLCGPCAGKARVALAKFRLETDENASSPEAVEP